MCVSVRALAYARTRMCLCVGDGGDVWVCASVYLDLCESVCMRARACVCMCVRVCVCACACV